MSEPVYVAQTCDPKHTRSRADAGMWFSEQLEAARAKGGTFPRYTISRCGDKLLFECWTERPSDQGAPRWAQAHDTEEAPTNG